MSLLFVLIQNSAIVSASSVPSFHTGSYLNFDPTRRWCVGRDVQYKVADILMNVVLEVREISTCYIEV